MPTPPDIERIHEIPRLPRRTPDAHKGQFGSVLAIAGSRGMAGAAALVGASALRSGAGRVRVASPAEAQPIVATYDAALMTWPLPQDEHGRIDFPRARDELEAWVKDATVIACGPGLGRSEGLDRMIAWLVEDVEQPLVLDADALNALAGQMAVIERRAAPLVLTPHPGECARLAGRTVAEVQADREGQAVALARCGPAVVVVLKGTPTVVTDGRRLALNQTGNPGMATAGSGDCLTGVIAALVGQGLSAFDAAVLGAHVHGLAGDIARDQSGEVGMVAGDIVDALPDAFYHLGAEE
jgi:ADP-dependent NAD(P)H-hydrate dehydratase